MGKNSKQNVRAGSSALHKKYIYIFDFYQVRYKECVSFRNYSLKFCKRLLYLVIKIYISIPSINLMNNNLICCGQRSQHLIIYREAIYGLRPPHFIMDRYHNI